MAKNKVMRSSSVTQELASSDIILVNYPLVKNQAHLFVCERF